MDVVSHFLIPYAAALAFLGLARPRPLRPGADAETAQIERWRGRLALAVVFGVGGVMPDIDSVYGWLRHAGELYYLQHRGFSHSLLGVALHALLGAGIIHLVATLFPRRFGWLRWRAAYIPAAVLGGMTHLILDGVTYMGVPLFWPLSPERYTLNLYPWLLIWVFPLSLALLALHLMRRLSHPRLVKLTAVIVVLILVSGLVRIDARPDLLPGEQAFPRTPAGEWIVLTRDPDADDAWFVQRVVSGEPREPQWRNATNIEPGSESAVTLAMHSNPYRGLRLGTPGPIVTETRALDDGVWEVNFTAIVARYDATTGARWTPANPTEAWGLLTMRVHPEEGSWQVERAGW